MIKITKPPIAYTINPKNVGQPGVHWVMVYLENVGNKDLKSMSVNVNSLDDYSVDVHGTGSYLDVLRVNQEQGIPFQLAVARSGMVYIRIEGWQGDTPFSWESLGILIRVNEEVAELLSFFALTPPYPFRGTPVELEATVFGHILSKNLVLEFWAETPRGETQSLAKMGTETLAAGEQQRYTVMFTPEEEGIYILHVYLYDNSKRIGHQTFTLSVAS